MNKNGFTLVELLAVIVLLGVLSVVIIPKIGESVINSKESAYNVQVESIKKGINDFLIENSDLLINDGVFEIKLGVVKQAGFLPVNIKNPITRKNFSNESIATITKNGENISIDLLLYDLVDVSENIDSNTPILVLNGKYITYVNVNDSYEELWVNVKSIDGNSVGTVSSLIKKGDEEVLSIDTSTLGTYNIIYEATDNLGNIVSANRTVIVADMESPVITVSDETVLSLADVSSFDIMDGVVVSDNYDTSVDVTYESNLTNSVGSYVVTYIASDDSMNKTTLRRIIRVIE